jgi:hypothetical protein
MLPNFGVLMVLPLGTICPLYRRGVLRVHE